MTYHPIEENHREKVDPPSVPRAWRAPGATDVEVPVRMAGAGHVECAVCGENMVRGRSVDGAVRSGTSWACWRCRTELHMDGMHTAATRCPRCRDATVASELNARNGNAAGEPWMVSGCSDAVCGWRHVYLP